MAAIVPGEGVRLEGGELVRARAVVSNADPVRTAALLEGDVPDRAASRLASWRITSPVIKLNCALSRLPTFPAANGDPTVYRGAGRDRPRASTTRRRRATPRGAACRRRSGASCTSRRAYDASVAPPGTHTMSVFAQFVPYELAVGHVGRTARRDRRRDARRDRPLRARRRRLCGRAPGARPARRRGADRPHRRAHLPGRVPPRPDVGPPFAPRYAVDGVYLCGAGTHPGGSVMAVNGRNAAMAVLEDLP